MKVSVLIPVWNQQELVIKALESIPKRDDIEILVCDDGSLDNTWNNLLEYAQKNKNVKLYRNLENKGVAYTLNRLYEKATGEYVEGLGSDDYYYTENFEKALNELDGTDIIFFQTSNNYGMVELNEHNKCGSFKFMRREFMKDLRYDEFRLAGEDYHLWKKILAKKPTIKTLDLKVKHYNYPRIGSLCWQLNQGMIDLESGINKDKTVFKLDGKVIENLIIKDIANGFNVSFTPSALIPLNNGTHAVSIRIEDNAGNFAVKDFNVVVDNTIPKMSATINDNILRVDDVSVYTLSATSTNFDKLYLTIKYQNIDVNDIVLSESYTKNVISNDNNTLHSKRCGYNPGNSADIITESDNLTNNPIIHTNLNLLNVWDRVNLYYHATFADTKHKIIGRNGEHWDSPNKQFIVDENSRDQFNIWFTSDGRHRILPHGCVFNIDLAFLLNPTNNTATGVRSSHDSFK